MIAQRIVSIKRCVEYDYEYDIKTDNVRKICKQEEFLLPKGSSPFDLVGILILNDVSPLASDCRDGIGNSELCGKLLVVPAIFIDYLNENVNIQRWQNLGWNTFNVAVTIATFGEGALAIQAIRGAAAGTRLTVTFQKSFQLLDFAYTATNIGMGLTQSGPFDCQNLSDPEEIKKCNEKWKIWNEIGLAFAVKGGLDLTENIIKATVKLKNLTREEIKQFIQAIKLKKYNKVATDDDILKTVEELEELIYRNDDLKRQYEQLLAAANTDVPSFKTNFLSKLDSYPEDLSVFKNWVNSLTDEQASLLQKLDALGDDIVKLANDFDFSNSNAVSKFVNDPYLIDSWNVLKAFPQIRVKKGNIEVLSRVSGRFKYNNKNSFEGLFDLFNGSATSKQKLIDGLAKVDEVFDKSLPVTFSGIKAGEVKVTSVDGTGDEIARYVDGILQKKKSLEDGEIVGKYDGDDILKNGDELGFRKVANDMDDLAAAWKTGWNEQKVLDLPKGNRPDDVSTYLKQDYINAHISKFDQEGAGFIVVKSWTEGGNPLYTTLPERKFVGLRSEMDAVINKYKSQGNDWTVLRDDLNLGPNTNLSTDEIYYIKIDPKDSRFSFDMPNGNEGGAIPGEWIPGGYTKNGTTEAALIGSENISHNKNINELLNNFTNMWEKIK